MKQTDGIANFTNNILGVARIVERAFNIGPCALSETVHMLENRLQHVKASNEGMEKAGIHPNSSFATEPMRLRDCRSR